jgi:ATP-dependent Clp protease ATP-binding subunit ClpC
MEKHTVSRMIGSPPGYVGFEEGGQLSEQVRRSPYSVVLLDEIEKAHPDIYNLLLQVLEDGRLTDSFGNVIDFTNTLIIMTSNLGSRDLLADGRMGFASDRKAAGSAEVKEIVDRQLRRHFPPEFLNRIDDVIVFEALTEESMLEVARLLIEETFTNLARQRIHMELDPAIPGWLLEQCGMDPHAGARPMRRLVRRWIEDAVADHLISHGSDDGARLVVQLEGGVPVVKAGSPVAQSQESP